MLTRLHTWLKFSGSACFSAPAGSVEPVPAAVGPRAQALILSFEGMDQPWRRPPGASGITIGHGFDLGYTTGTEFKDAWSRHLSATDFHLLATALGETGANAEALESRFTGVTPITEEQADEVFFRCTLPKYRDLAARTFPGLQALNPDQQGVLVSLVFNRGSSLKGERRSEMAEIHSILQSDSVPATKARQIAGLIRRMKRLWPSHDSATGDPGLRRRRDAEAALMETSCL